MRVGRGELQSNGDKAYVGDDKKVLEIDGGDGYTTWICMHIRPLNCTLTGG